VTPNTDQLHSRPVRRGWMLRVLSLVAVAGLVALAVYLGWL
jgi:hypothetical protein